MENKVYIVVCDWHDDYIDFGEGTNIIGVYGKKEDAKKAISDEANKDLDGLAKYLVDNPELRNEEDGWVITIEYGDGDTHVFRCIEEEVR